MPYGKRGYGLDYFSTGGIMWLKSKTAPLGAL
jgi:hypothetical protein